MAGREIDHTTLKMLEEKIIKSSKSDVNNGTLNQFLNLNSNKDKKLMRNHNFNSRMGNLNQLSNETILNDWYISEERCSLDPKSDRKGVIDTFWTNLQGADYVLDFKVKCIVTASDYFPIITTFNNSIQFKEITPGLKWIPYKKMNIFILCKHLI